jgi:hypothetical protein
MTMSIVVAAGCSREKDRLDEEVRQLCLKDGGIKVYETVLLPNSEYQKLLNKYGDLEIPNKQYSKPEYPFFQDVSITYLREGNPEMSRAIYKLIRRSDQKVLATSTFYSRGGGDFPGPWHESSFICPDTKASPDMANIVIRKSD